MPTGTKMKERKTLMAILFTEDLTGGTGVDCEPAQQEIPFDLYEKNDRYTAVFSVPGVRPKNIDISLSGEVLTVKANRSILDFETGKHLINPGAFGEKEYVVHLPHDADLDNISATCEDGLLVVDIPLVANVLPRKIEVKSKSGENKNV